MRLFESTASDRDNGPTHWSVYATSARENPAEQMLHKLVAELNSVGRERGRTAA